MNSRSANERLQHPSMVGPLAGLPQARGTGPYSVLLVAVLLLFLGGLWMADRALTEASRDLLRNDAREAAVLLSQAMEHHRQVLQDARAVFAGPRAAGAEAEGVQLRRLLPGVVQSWPALERFWVVDAAGVVLVDTVLSRRAWPTPPMAYPGVRALVERARQTGEVQLGLGPVAPDRSRTLVLVEPLTVGDTLRATAAALVPASELVTALARRYHTDVDGVVVRIGRDTLVRTGGLGDAEVERAVEPVPMIGGAAWTVEVRREVGRRTIRRVLWTVSLGVALLLAAGLLRERQQALRVAERSAELERLSSELLRANRMKSEFLANVSHELRTPLNAIVGFVELLRDGVYGELSPRQVQPVERIAASATHLRHLVDQVLDIAKIAAGRLEVHPETIVLRPFVLNVASELESLTSEKGLSLSITVGASLPRVRTDPQHLRQILVNLIGNAVKYTPTGGIIVRARLVPPEGAVGAERLSTEEVALRRRSPSPDRPWVALQVIDTGIGIAPEDQERIFDEFEQVNAGPRGESMQRGTGLGLAISRRLARLLDGEITLDSAAGRGSTFTLWLPVSPGESAKAA